MASLHDLMSEPDQPAPFIPKSLSEAEKGDKKANDAEDCFEIELRTARIFWCCIGFWLGIPLTIFIIYYVISHTLSWKENFDIIVDEDYDNPQHISIA